jgi:hypothetical protein
VDDHEEIATNYVDSGESYYRKTNLVDIYFASKIANSLDPDAVPKSMIDCQKRSDWSCLGTHQLEAARNSDKVGLAFWRR